MRRNWILAAFILSVLAAGITPAQDNPIRKDKTGMRWALPFAKARQRSETEGRLLLIKPVAFGTSKDGGW